MLLALVCLRESFRDIIACCHARGASTDGQVGAVLVGLDTGVDPNYLVRAHIRSLAVILLLAPQ